MVEWQCKNSFDKVCLNIPRIINIRWGRAGSSIEKVNKIAKNLRIWASIRQDNKQIEDLG